MCEPERNNGGRVFVFQLTCHENGSSDAGYHLEVRVPAWLAGASCAGPQCRMINPHNGLCSCSRVFATRLQEIQRRCKNSRHERNIFHRYRVGQFNWHFMQISNQPIKQTRCYKWRKYPANSGSGWKYFVNAIYINSEMTSYFTDTGQKIKKNISLRHHGCRVRWYVYQMTKNVFVVVVFKFHVQDDSTVQTILILTLYLKSGQK